MCTYGDYVNCHTIKPALSIFSLEMFITSIDADGFDHLLGKWPFVMSNYFDGGENSNNVE
ncbi:hypothetical protein Mgra_00003081 [Meloidogyne graminicola]|uniref:Uncharacterized protein n=1 Tax=Meloidogyne graminicola TaxID=189291 RepID=A0A8S9ZWP3_9BILA|nr:hypothetical protein Mgra_00003079 [Meloidogyne graminicola]KAF7637563.1 hypothetical protein Mgra_00003081 [Meloidogyne graminicola]